MIRIFPMDCPTHPGFLVPDKIATALSLGEGDRLAADWYACAVAATTGYWIAMGN